MTLAQATAYATSKNIRSRTGSTEASGRENGGDGREFCKRMEAVQASEAARIARAAAIAADDKYGTAEESYHQDAAFVAARDRAHTCKAAYRGENRSARAAAKEARVQSRVEAKAARESAKPGRE